MKGKQSILKWILFAGFAMGILLANLAGKETLKQVGALSFTQEQSWQYDGEKVIEDRIYLIEKRVVVWVLFLVLGSSSSFFLLYWFLAFWVGFSFGLLQTAAVFEKGLQGSFYLLVAVLPHFILYFIAFYLLYRKRFRQKTALIPKFSGKKQLTKAQCRKIAQLGVENILLFIVFFTGVLSESFMNPWLIRKIVSIFR